MKSKLLIAIACCILTGCSKEILTEFYEDKEDPGLSVFTNNGSNILSCYVDGKAWRTEDRVGYILSSGTNYEVEIRKTVSTAIMDTLTFSWYGYFQGNEFNKGAINLKMAVPKDFSYRNFNAFDGQRFQIDSMQNGYFTTSINVTGRERKGNGNIYFVEASFDSIAPDRFFGHMAGLIDASFPSFNIARGRFDETLNEENTQLR